LPTRLKARNRRDNHFERFLACRHLSPY
jgi:hypothetical protein